MKHRDFYAPLLQQLTHDCKLAKLMPCHCFVFRIRFGKMSKRPFHYHMRHPGNLCNFIRRIFCHLESKAAQSRINLYMNRHMPFGFCSRFLHLLSLLQGIDRRSDLFFYHYIILFLKRRPKYQYWFL